MTTTTPGIDFEVDGALGLITLDRPRALNALTHDMIRAMSATLAEWAADESIGSVMVRGAGEKAFCAGGDVLAFLEPGSGPLIEEFFRDEYRLNRMIFRYPKPYVAFIDGIAMGGGVGISVHGRYRVVTERTMFAMPETGIGMFPDVGGSYFLPRLAGELGMYLGLTGTRLGAADCIHAGLAEACIAADRQDELLAALVEGRDPGQVLLGMDEDVAEAPIDPHRDAIDRCFAGDSVEAMLERLDAEGDEWAGRAREKLLRMSPTALKIAVRQLRAGRDLGFEDCMVMEYRLSQHVVPGHDFREGVRALLIDKDMNPRWQPETLGGVSAAALDAWFAPLEGGDLEFPDLAW